MKMNDLIKLVQNSIAALNGRRTTAVSIGDIEQIVSIDAKIEEAQATLDKLRTLPE